jgi:hypothetical protein
LYFATVEGTWSNCSIGKRLERGSFIIPRMHAIDGRIERRELSLLLEGVVPKKVTQRYRI